MNMMQFTSNRLSHAYILIGSSALKLTETALAISQLVNCSGEAEAATPCGQCINCRKLERGVHPDSIHIQPQGASQSIMIEQIRNLQREVATKPIEGRKKVVVISEAHRMREESQNCLLKTLEEPPDSTLLLLLTDKLSGLLPTVQSRCRLLFLEGEKALPPQEDFELVEDVFRDLKMLGFEGAFKKATFLYKSRKSDLPSFFNALEIMLRDGLVETAGQPSFISDEGSESRVLRVGPENIALTGSVSDFREALKLLWQYMYLFERNVNTLLLLENLFIRLSKMSIQNAN